MIGKSVKFGGALILLWLLLLPRVISLDAHWSSDESRWLRRSQGFIAALQEGRFNDTQQSYHPGVITTWLSGVSLWLKYRQDLPFADSSIQTPLISVDNLSRARLSVSIVVFCIIALAFLLIRQLHDTRLALLSGLLIICDPIFLAQSRRLHTDALAAGFILLTLLFFLLYLERPQYLRSLIASGICFGLACLAKSNSLILGFCFPFIVLLYFPSGKSSNQGFLTVDLIITQIVRLLLLFSTACLTSIFFWPALWTIDVRFLGHTIPVSLALILMLFGAIGITAQILIHQSKSSSLYAYFQRPMGRLSIFGIFILILIVSFFCFHQVPSLLNGVIRAIQTEHGVAHFFLNKVIYDPGWLFYPLMLSIKSAPLTLPLCLVGIVLLWQKRLESQYIRIYRVFCITFDCCSSVYYLYVCWGKKIQSLSLTSFPNSGYSGSNWGIAVS